MAPGVTSPSAAGHGGVRAGRADAVLQRLQARVGGALVGGEGVLDLAERYVFCSIWPVSVVSWRSSAATRASRSVTGLVAGVPGSAVGRLAR